MYYHQTKSQQDSELENQVAVYLYIDPFYYPINDRRDFVNNKQPKSALKT